MHVLTYYILRQQAANKLVKEIIKGHRVDYPHVYVRGAAPPPLLHNVQPSKAAAMVYCWKKADDELGRGNRLTLPKLEYDTSRPAS